MELARFLPRKDYTREYETLSYPRVELLKQRAITRYYFV